MHLPVNYYDRNPTLAREGRCTICSVVFFPFEAIQGNFCCSNDYHNSCKKC